jgi:hypothetical protein
MPHLYKRSLLISALLYAGLQARAQNAQQVITVGGAQSTAVSGYTIDFGIGESVIATAGQGPVLTQGFLQPLLAGDFAVAQLLLKAQPQNTFIQLNWTTTSETDNNLFYIERSADGITFITIDSIPSKAIDGNSTTPLDYQQADISPLNGNNYYRIRQVDQHKNIRYSATVLAIFRQDKWSAHIYPNPVHGVLKIKLFTSTGTSCTFRLVNLLGQECIVRKYISFPAGYNDYTLHMDNLPAGIYFLIITAHNHGSHQTFKLLKTGRP